MKNNDFLIEINDVHLAYHGEPIENRFKKMSEEVSIYSYLTQYHKQMGAKDSLPNNSFVGLNVKTTKIIPFFAYKNKEGDEILEDRTRIIRKQDEIMREDKDVFSSFPDFLRYSDIENIEFVIDSSYNVTIENVEFFSNSNEMEKKKQVENCLGEFDHSKSFIAAWYNSVLDAGNTEIRAVVKVSDPNREGVGNSFFVILFPNEYVQKAPGIVEALLNTYSIPLLDIISIIKSLYIGDIRELQRRESIKSAKAAIMSRNMSHNIGSHVMSYLKQKLGSITAIMSGENKVLYNLIDGEKVNLNVLEKKPAPKVENKEQSASEKKNQLQLPFLVGTGRFIGYLQERQDYIATIATDYIPYGAPVNLKDAIYDELNPDLRYMRHKADDNKPMNVLLSFIAKSEGLSRENMDNCSVENDVKADKFDTNHDILFGFPKYVSGKKEPEVFGLLPGQCESENEALTVMRKINFSLPGGLVGRQAIFSIVENLIRNAAKHGDRSHTRKNNLEFTFDVIDLAKLEEEPCLEDRICSERWRNLYEKASDRRDLYLFTITDNLAYPTGEGNLAEKLRPALTDDYVDDMGNMNTSNKGIKEIRISAAWMRGEVDETRYLRYDDSANALSWKKAPLVGLEITNEGHLRYMICLPQDRLAAVITDGLSEADLELFRDLNKYSSKDWTLCSIDEAKANNKTSYHYILVANKELYDQIRPVTSNRLFVWNLTNEERAELDECRRQEKADSARYKLTRNAIVRKLYGINAESDPVCIWDGKTKDNEDSNLDKSVSDKIKIFRTDENADEARYVYRTHHSTDANFEDYWKKKSQTAAYGNILRIDAITGDNSSDRIVRREPLNEEWYCSHLRALKKRVAIFDERLFKIVHNVDERKFIPERQGDGDSSSSISSYIMRLKNNENLQTIKEEIVRQKLLGEETEKVMMFVDTAEELIKELEHQAVYFIPQSANNYKSIIYQEKGVDVFTIIKEKKNTFAIVGYIGHYTDKEGMLQATKYDKVATITFTADPFDVKIDFQHDEFAKQYDYISIHQGILDKIYEGFGIKDQGEANDLKKCHVTKRLHEEFMREGRYTPIPVVDREGNAQSGDLDFLPCFIIHSGRAKPTKNDMPQELPFVQYAAIEHGVQDCKYALVELLDYARYES